MGYEFYAVLVVDPEEYTKKELEPWAKKWKEQIDSLVIEEDYRMVFTLDWGKGVYKAIDDFMANYVKVLEGDDGTNYPDNDTYGWIMLGETSDDVEEAGTPWEFDVYMHRSIEF
jgi:hypothetical protein